MALAAVFVYGGMRSTAPNGSFVQVHDHQVAVVTDELAGTSQTVLAPGYQMVLPHLELVHALDKSPVEYVMAGEEFKSPNHVSRLIVRGKDGSSFWFNRVGIQYGLDTARLERVLQDSGLEDGFKRGLMNLCARSILRDELGRLTPEEVVEPEKIQEATRAAKESINVVMQRHGLTIYELSLSKPSFDKRYEETIERRKVAEQVISRLERDAQLMVKGKGAKHAEIEGQHELDIQKGESQWKHELDLLVKEGEKLSAGQDEELVQLQRYQELAKIKARDQWGGEFEALVRSALENEAEQDERLAAGQRVNEMIIVEARSKWDRELAALVLEGEGRRNLKAARTAALRGDHAQMLAEMRATMSGNLSAARESAVRSAFLARQKADGDLLSARIERDRRVAQAEVRAAAARVEAQAFSAETELLAKNGATAVRAALVNKLSSIVFEIIPFSRPTPDQVQETHKVAAQRGL